MTLPEEGGMPDLSHSSVSDAERASLASDRTPRVLDPCCGGRMWWFDRQHPDAIYGDRRSETLVVTDRSHGNVSGTRTLRIEPDQVFDFRELPFADGAFKLVAFDPPHLVRAGPKSWLAAKYGKLSADWRDDLRQGFAECFRVLATDGVLVFKWNETQVRIREVLALTPYRPLFGNTSGKNAGTHWMVFMKPEGSAATPSPGEPK
jgi:SAM-dependent methyltransferase